jgi:hypothetical protein
MFTLGVLLGLILLIIITFVIKHIINSSNYSDVCDIVGVICIVFAGVLFIGMAVVFPMSYTDQLTDYNTIKQYQNQKVIYEKKSEVLLPQFKHILLEKYPIYEKDMFDKMTINDYQMYLVKYLELKNIEAVKYMIDNINTNYNSIYDMDLKIEEVKKNIRTRNQNIFIIVPHYNVD